MTEEILTNVLDPQVYFDILKSKKQKCTDEFLNQFRETIELELGKAMKTGQNYMVKRLAYAMSIIEKERELQNLGIDAFVYKEDIVDYIDNVADKACKIIELEMYPRSIPDEIAQKVAELKDKKLFDRLYIVFTDYTGEITKKVAEEKKRRDPIIFGAFEQKIDGVWDVFDRFYFIADWEDEYCDLTLSKMVDAMSKKKKDIVNPVGLDKPTPDAVRAYLNALQEQEENRFRLAPRKQSYFKNISTTAKSLIKAIIGK